MNFVVDGLDGYRFGGLESSSEEGLFHDIWSFIIWGPFSTRIFMNGKYFLYH